MNFQDLQVSWFLFQYDSLVMAGGKGSRMNIDTEKLLLKYKKPIITCN